MTEASLQVVVERYRGEIDLALGRFVNGIGGPQRLQRVARFALLSPGKRIRAILLLLAAEGLAAQQVEAIKAATAVEAIHAASLILDDLPAMDDASVRRGQATAHCEFDEASAILAAIALLNGAYAEVATVRDAGPQAVATLTRAVGGAGLVGGQMRDLYPPESPASVSFDDVVTTHGAKTGALFAAALALGGVSGGKDDVTVDALWSAGLDLGLAFQGYDDLLDRYAVSSHIGKETGADEDKATVASFMSRGEAEAWCEQRVDAARDVLAATVGSDARLLAYVDQMHAMLTAPLSKAAE